MNGQFIQRTIVHALATKRFLEEDAFLHYKLMHTYKHEHFVAIIGVIRFKMADC